MKYSPSYFKYLVTENRRLRNLYLELLQSQGKLMDQFEEAVVSKQPSESEPTTTPKSSHVAEDLITMLGGPTEVGEAFNIRPQAVSLWKMKGRIPAHRLPSLVRMAKARGIDVDPSQIRSDVDWSALR